VHELQAVEHGMLLERVDQLDDLRGREAEDAAVAARLVPRAAYARGELHSHAEHRADPEGPARLQDDRQLGRGLEHEEDAVAELERLQAERDELGVLVAVADDVAGVGLHAGERDEELGLAAGLEPCP